MRLLALSSKCSTAMAELLLRLAHKLGSFAILCPTKPCRHQVGRVANALVFGLAAARVSLRLSPFGLHTQPVLRQTSAAPATQTAAATTAAAESLHLNSRCFVCANEKLSSKSAARAAKKLAPKRERLDATFSRRNHRVVAAEPSNFIAAPPNETWQESASAAPTTLMRRAI